MAYCATHTPPLLPSPPPHSIFMIIPSPRARFPTFSDVFLLGEKPFVSFFLFLGKMVR
jgi:hypothetical protein